MTKQLNIYLDQNIVIDLINNLTREKEEILNDTKFKFNLSAWNLIEACINIVTSEQKKRAVDLGNFIDQKIRPVWVYPSSFIMTKELKKFIYKQKYDSNYSYSFATSSLNAMLGNHWLKFPLILNMSAKKIIEQLISNPRIINDIRTARDEAVKLMAALKAKKEKSSEDLYLKILKERLDNCLPKPFRDIYKAPILLKDRQKLIDYCIDNKNLFFANCPTWGIEEYFYQYRIIEKEGKIDKNSVIDLQHCLPAIAYVNFFITNDSDLFKCCDFVKKNYAGNNIAKLVRNITDIL